jgi:hypothetical protein
MHKQYRKAPIVVRPPTPELRVPVAENDEKRLAVIFLQRLLRGRAIQNDMFQAKVCSIRAMYAAHASCVYVRFDARM